MTNQTPGTGRRQLVRTIPAEGMQVTPDNETEVMLWLRELGFGIAERGRGFNVGTIVFGKHDWATQAVRYGHYLVLEAGVVTCLSEAAFAELGYCDNQAGPVPCRLENDHG